MFYFFEMNFAALFVLLFIQDHSPVASSEQQQHLRPHLAGREVEEDGRTQGDLVRAAAPPKRQDKRGVRARIGSLPEPPGVRHLGEGIDGLDGCTSRWDRLLVRVLL